MGYFRIFYYITYILNFLLRLIKRHGKAILWFVCIAVFLVICMYNPKSQAIYIGDYNYGDLNYAMRDMYEQINMNLLRRFPKINSASQSALNQFKSLVSSNAYNVYMFYGTTSYNGTNGNIANQEMVNGYTYNQHGIYVLLYRPRPQYYTISPDPQGYDNYGGVYCDLKLLTTSNYYLFGFGATDVSLLYYNIPEDTHSGDYNLYFPSAYFGYLDDYFYNYFFNNYSLEEIELLYDMKNKINQANQELQAQTDYLTEEPSSEDFSTSDLPTDSGVTDPTTSQVDNIFTTVYNVFTGNVEVSKRNINVSIPFTR